MKKKSRGVLAGHLLATSSVVALVAGVQTPAAAACYTGPYPYTNAGAVSCVSVANTSFSGDIVNSGTIGPGGMVVAGSTITGSIDDEGTIIGGISLDASSSLDGSAPSHSVAIFIDTTSSFGGGIFNGGDVIASTNETDAFGIYFNGASLVSGGISNSGTISASADFGEVYGIGVVNVSTFTGGVANSGTISAAGPHSHAVIVDDVLSFSGGIVNAAGGTMAGETSVIAVRHLSQFSGGINNAGTITVGSGFGYGIALADVGTTTSVGASTFIGGVTNSGTIHSFRTGILVYGSDSFAGGITNSGTISSSGGVYAGINFDTVGTLTGGILNAANATISAGLSGIRLNAVNSFAGGISNAGTIVGGTQGVAIHTVSLFSGGIDNSGTISAGMAAGFDLFHVSTFSGGIANAANGTIVANYFAVWLRTVDTFAGGISNAGTITTGLDGIKVDTVSSFSGGISNSGTIDALAATAIGVHVLNTSRFSGGISNSGTIAGAEGIAVGNTSLVDGAIVNSGTIQGTSGTAIDLSTALGPVTVQQAGGTLLGTIQFSSHGDTLMGNGTIVGNLIAPGVTIQTGLGHGNALQIAGNLTQSAASKTVIEISPAAAAQLLVTGTASIAGGLTLVYDPGTYTDRTYNLIHAGTTLAGTFATTTSIDLPANGTQTLTYTSNDLDLALSGVRISTPTGAFGDAADLAVSGGFDADNIVFGHLDEHEFGEGADQVKTALAGAAPIQVAMNGPLQQLAQASSRMSEALAHEGAWVRGVGSFFDADHQGTASGFSASGGGVLAGIDHPFGPVTLGIAGGYSGTNFTQNDGESGDVQTIRALLYAHYHAAPQVIVDGLAGFAYDRIHTSRQITSLGTDATETHNGFEENLALQAGYVMPGQGFTLIPRLGAQYLHLHENRFSETGGSGFNLSRGAADVDSFQPSIGITVLEPFALDNGMRVTPAFKLSYSHELLNPNETLALTTPSAVSVPASIVTPAHNVVTLGPSATLRLNDSLNLYADYKLSIGIGRSLDHVVFAGARLSW